MQRTDLATAGDPATLQRAVATLRGLPYFGNLTDPLLTKLVRRGTLVALDAGEQLICEGDLSAHEMYVLLDGVFLVQSKSRLILRLDQPGDVVGELAVLQAPPRTADVLAGAATRAVAIKPEVVALPEFADVAAVFYMMLSHSLANKLRATTAHSRQQIDRATREAATDALTGLANRKRLDEFLAEVTALSTSRDEPFSLIIADIDHFKRYNDANGHPMGDIALAKIGMILQAHIRSGDLAARYGGEEFVVVLPNCADDDATRIAEKLRSVIENDSFPRADGKSAGRVTATFGVAANGPAGDAEDLLKRADQALYQGKSAGRNVVVTAPPVARRS